MKSFRRKYINPLLSLFSLKIVHARNKYILGNHLFDDLKLLIRNDSPICIDVGANVGQTIDSLLKIFTNPTIHAFEPSTKTFKTLLSKAFGDQVFLYNMALGKEIQKREFINYNESVLSSFLPLDSDEENRFRLTGIDRKEIVEIDTLDRFYQRSNLNEIDLLKIDTQGFDLEVLLGAKEALHKRIIRNVLVELNFVKMYKGQSSPEAIIGLLKEFKILLVDYYEKEHQNETLAWCTALFKQC